MVFLKAWLEIVRREREAAEKERQKEEEERKRRKEEEKRKRVILEAAFDGDKEMIINVIDEVGINLFYNCFIRKMP